MVIRAELPGMKREDVDVSLSHGVLTISGERKEEQEHKEKGYLIRERKSGSFRRSMTLPEGVDEGGIKARFEDGVLEVKVEGGASAVEESPRKDRDRGLGGTGAKRSGAWPRFFDVRKFTQGERDEDRDEQGPSFLGARHGRRSDSRGQERLPG